MWRLVHLGALWLAAVFWLGVGCSSYDAGLLDADAGQISLGDGGDAATQPADECRPLPDRQTDPADRDHDGIPDVVERRHGFDPVSPGSPGRDRITYLRRSPTGEATALVDVWVDGMDLVYRGRFESIAAYDRTGLTAEDFYAGSEARGGEPRDHVLRVEPGAERIGPVRGETRLRYAVDFRFDGPSSRDCFAALPFRYVLEREDGRVLNSGARYLLVLAPAEDAAGVVWCLPKLCS